MSYFFECFLIEDEFLEPGQWPISVYIATFLENITVSSEVITRGTYNVQDLHISQ